MLTLQVSVLYSGSGTLDDVGVSIVLPHPVVAAHSTYVIPSLRGGTPEIICIHLRACGKRSRASIPASNVALIMASYCTHKIENSISTQEVQLPLSLFCVVASPMKTAKHKITIEINWPLPCLMDLFKDMIPIPQMDDVMTTTGNVLGFQFHNGVNVTIVTSKTAGRFRIQSSDFNAIWLLLSEFIYRLWAHVDLQTTSSSMDAPLKVSLQEPLPLQNLFEIIEEYYSTKLECDMDNINISSYAHSFRAVKKSCSSGSKVNIQCQYLTSAIFSISSFLLSMLSSKTSEIVRKVFVGATKTSCCYSTIDELGTTSIRYGYGSTSCTPISHSNG